MTELMIALRLRRDLARAGRLPGPGPGKVAVGCAAGVGPRPLFWSASGSTVAAGQRCCTSPSGRPVGSRGWYDDLLREMLSGRSQPQSCCHPSR